jgi:hypothetical protein
MVAFGGERWLESPRFSTNGRVQLRKERVAQLVAEIARAMRAAGELERGPFSMRDLRRTAETRMAALAVSSDVCAQIQSHGLGGIQVPTLRPPSLHAREARCTFVVGAAVSESATRTSTDAFTCEIATGW